MAENQANHRQDLERRVIKSDVRNSVVGLIFGLIVSLAAIGAGVWLIHEGKSLEGSILSGLVIVSLVGTFIYGSQAKRRDREQRQQ